MLPALLAASILALAACGDDDGDDGDGDGGFAAEANSICRALAVEEAEVNAELGVISGESETIEQIERFEAAEREQLRELRSLQPPADARRGYERFLALRRRLVELADEGVAAVEGPASPAAFNQLNQERIRLLDRAREAASGIGLEVCAAELGADAERGLRDLVERAATGEVSGEECLELHTEAYAAGSGFGENPEACVESLPMAEAVEITGVFGVEGVSAQVRATIEGAPNQALGERDELMVELTHEDGWKIDHTDTRPEG